MTRRLKLTAKRVADFQCDPAKQQDFLHDSEVPGLAVRATRGSPVKSYVFRFRLRGEAPRVTIGDVRAWDIESTDPQRPGAREEARRLQTLVDQGIDPREDRTKRDAKALADRKENARRDASFAEAWTAYVEDRRPKWGARHLVDHENLARPGGEKRKRGKRMTTAGPLAPLLRCPLAELNAERLKAWLRAELGRRPTQARLAFGALRTFVRWCADTSAYRGIVDPAIFEGPNVRSMLPKKAAKSDCLQRNQLKAWFASVRAIENATIAVYLQTLLLTGARREELAGLTWANVGFKGHTLTIRDKVDGERTIPLTPYVEMLLRDLQGRNVRPLRLPAEEQWQPSPWVFASPTAESGRIQEPRIAHNRALRIAAIDDLTLHGLRRSFATLAEYVECPAGVVAQIMGHKPSATAERHYKIRPLDLLLLWHARIERWMLAEAGIMFEAPQEAKSADLRLLQGAYA